MNFLRRLFRKAPDPSVLTIAQKVDDLETRLHHLEVANRDLLARVAAAEGDLAWIVRPDEQPLPAPSDLPEGVVYHHKK